MGILDTGIDLNAVLSGAGNAEAGDVGHLGGDRRAGGIHEERAVFAGDRQDGRVVAVSGSGHGRAGGHRQLKLCIQIAADGADALDQLAGQRAVQAARQRRGMRTVAVGLVLQLFFEDDAHNLRKLRAGDVVLRTEGAVLIAVNDLGLHKAGNILFSPFVNFARVLEALQIRRFAFHTQQLGDDLHGFLAGDERFRAERAVLIPVEQTLAGGGQNLVHIPALGHVRELHILDLSRVKRTVEHGRNFSALDRVVGTDCAGVIALQNAILDAVHDFVIRPVRCFQVGKADVRCVRGDSQSGKQADDQRQHQCEG